MKKISNTVVANFTAEENEIIWVCSECGNKEVHVRAWVHANTNTLIDDIDSECWCCLCEDHSRITTEKEYKSNEKEKNRDV